MEDRILDLLKERSLTVYEISDGLGFKEVEQLKELLKVLYKMEEDLKIYHTKKDKYVLFSDSHLKIGTFLANKKGFGFVDIDGDEDVFIAPPNINGAIHGDRVVVEVISPKGIDLEGRILKIAERKFDLLVGEFYYKKGVGYVDLDDDKMKMNIEIVKNKTMGAMNGHKVLVKIIEKLSNNNYKGEIVKILGHKNDPGVDILSIVSKLNIPETFSQEVMDEVLEIPDEVKESELKNRRDLRNEVIFTIDGDDTKDIDDAISIKKLDDGNYELGVHIADVSYYVGIGSKIDSEAEERGTSVYLADRVIPMLPHKLSNGICSLNPDVDRLTISCVMNINEAGDVVDYDIFESVIKSRKQMTYKNVNKILEENTIPEGYEPFEKDLRMMKELADNLRKHKVRNGYIDFDIKESKIIVDDKGKAIDVVLRNRGIGENLIEDFMIAANETVATHIYNMELPFVYRVHGEPSKEKIESFLQFISVLGYKINGNYNKVTPKNMQELLFELKDKKEYQILSSLLLRSMQKAVYDKQNIGHFGLGSKCYTHFTSPIRRYPDQTVHRLLRTYMFNHNLDMTTISYWDKRLPIITEHSSFMERQSIECEREVDDMKKAEYMMDHIGEKFTGIISGVLSFGFFIELPNLIEGLVRIDSLGGNYVYDEATFTIRSNNDKRGYRLGDSVNVILVGANKDARTIDFEVDHGDKQ